MSWGLAHRLRLDVWKSCICLMIYFFCLNATGAVAQTELFVNSLGMEFVLITPGTFIMGSPAGEPYRDPDEDQHKVTISKAFYMQVSEVTQAQWKALMGSNSSYFKRCGETCPVERVSWLDCQKYIKKLNELGEGEYRLPTEAEWEYACRSGTTSAYFWGDHIDCSKAMFENNTRRNAGRCVAQFESRGLPPDSPAPVRSFGASPWGLYDMHGNLWEWCEDWYGPYAKGNVKDPTGPAEGSTRVRRGGSWFKYGTYCRSANRNFAHPASRYRTTGLRVVREPP